MKKRLALSLAAAAMVGTLAVGGTLAWFTDTETATNVVTMGDVDITLTEDGSPDGEAITGGIKYTDVMPGDQFKKDVTIKNNKNDAYVRAIITVSGNDAIMNTFANDEENKDDNITFVGLDENAEWTLNQDGSYSTTVYYVNNEAETGKEDIMTNGAGVEFKVFEAVKVPGKEWDNLFTNADFSIKVEAQAIQVANLTKEAAWDAMK